MQEFRRPRVIPCLLLRNNGLVKTVKFSNPTYLGDPRNILKIFNDKEADELALLDISATVEKRAPRMDLLREVASECFMPLGYGGGVRRAREVEEIISIGIEKVIINSAAVETPGLVEESAKAVGSQSIVASLDVRKGRFTRRYEVFTQGGRKATGMDPVTCAKRMEDAGAGEILLTSVDRDGTMSGYDLDLIGMVARAVRVPLIACGGARNVADLSAAVKAGSSAAGAGSMFVFQGRHRAVLISFPIPKDLSAVFGGRTL